MDFPQPTVHGLTTLEVWAVLRHASETQSFVKYQDLVRSLGIFTGGLVAILNSLMQEDRKHGRPLISSLVVSGVTGRPGDGFFKKARALGYDFEDEGQFWRSQCEALFELSPIRCCVCGKVMLRDGSISYRVAFGFEQGGFVEDHEFGRMHESCFNRAFPSPEAALAEIRKLAGKGPGKLAGKGPS